MWCRKSAMMRGHGYSSLRGDLALIHRGSEIAVLAVHVGIRSEEASSSPMSLPEDARARLLTVQLGLIAIGDVWWIPEDLARYPGGKDRFSLVVALEHPPGDEGRRPLVHFVAGSRGGRSEAITIKVDSGSCGLNEDTYFRFWWSGSIAGTDLVTAGKPRGRLPDDRVGEIGTCVKASKLVLLKRLLA